MIGLPGETIQIVDSKIYINGEILEENYGYEPIQDAKRAIDQPLPLARMNTLSWEQTRNDSSDSRDPAVGNVTRRHIIGKAWLRIWPLNKIGLINHRE